MTLSQVIHDALELDISNRVLLVQVLLSSFEDPGEEWLEEWTTECERRYESYKRGESRLYSLDEVMKDFDQPVLTHVA